MGFFLNHDIHVILFLLYHIFTYCNSFVQIIHLFKLKKCILLLLVFKKLSAIKRIEAQQLTVYVIKTNSVNYMIIIQIYNCTVKKFSDRTRN